MIILIMKNWQHILPRAVCKMSNADCENYGYKAVENSEKHCLM